jgi:hypothetical protein
VAVEIIWLIGTLLAVAAVSLTLLISRRLRLLRAGGVNVALRTRLNGGGRGWHLGVGRYHGDEFTWYRAFSLRSGPDRVIHRDGLEIATRREPDGPETYVMPAGSMVLRCRPTRADSGIEVEIAMGPDALTGFLSWLESAPPGGRLPWAS